MIFRRFALAIGLLFAGLFSQLPEFTQQYRQRLGGAIDELNAMIERFDTEAAALSLDREQAINRLKANSDMLAKDRGRSLEDSVNRKDQLEWQKRALETAGPVRQYVVLAEGFDPGIARQAYRDYQPAMPVTTAGFFAAGVGLVVGSLLTHLVTFPIRRRRPGPRTRSAPSGTA